MSKSHYRTSIVNADIDLVVIEDEDKLLKNICEYLILEGYRVVGFSDSLEALNYLENNAVNVIVSDVKMPGITGFELISAVRGGVLNKDAVFIFLTAKVERDDQRLGMNLQADDYITKPFAMQDLVNSINTRLNLVTKRTDKTTTRSTLVKQNVFELLAKLTKSEIRVVYLVALGKTNEQIAERLTVSPKTVDNHRTNISDKLSISGRNKLIKFSIENKVFIKEFISEKMRDMPHIF
jgi:DNA-binding NarL/FixJ family response regulator